MFKKIAIGFAVLVMAILAFAATRPDTFHVERTVSMKALPEKVFPLINDLRAQAQWSPWEKLDPKMKKTLSGPETGKGAAYEWDGNSEVGKGRIEIVDAVAPSSVTLKLDMLEPMEGHNTVEFKIAAKDGVTYVTWAMHGAQPYIGKLFSVFVDCDKMVGAQFESGLASLKAIAEK